MKAVILSILIIILLLILVKKNKETFANYILVNEPVNNFYMRFIDFILNERNPKNDYFVIQDKYGYPHLLHPKDDPRVVNPQFFFDEGLRYDYPWYNPNQKLIPL